MNFSELKPGDVFKFKWEEDSEWVYEKVGFDQVSAMKAPATHSNAINIIYPWENQKEKVVLYDNKTTIYLLRATKLGDDSPSYGAAYRDVAKARKAGEEILASDAFTMVEIEEVELL